MYSLKRGFGRIVPFVFLVVLLSGFFTVSNPLAQEVVPSAHAQGGAGGAGGGGAGGAGGGGAGGAGGGGAEGAACPDDTVCNPLNSDTINEFLLAIIDIVLIFLLPLIIFFIIYGGFLLTTARGDTGQIEKGRGTLTWAVIGGVVVLGAREIIKIIQGTVESL